MMPLLNQQVYLKIRIKIFKASNPNELIYNDIIDILAESADSKTAIYQGPGQSRIGRRSKQFNKLEALRNAAHFLTIIQQIDC